MGWVTEAELVAESDAFDDAAAATSHIDGFCSSTPWLLSAHKALMGEREIVVWRGADGWGAFARRENRQLGRFLEPLEALWGFASPFVGPDLGAVATEALGALAERAGWRTLLLAGCDLEGPVPAALSDARRPTWRLMLGAPTRRRRASLAGGFEGFLDRRSKSFRMNVRRAETRAHAAGVTLEHLTDFSEDPGCDRLFARVLSVEGRSWKGRGAVGIEGGRMEAFYRAMLPRLAGRGALRATLASLDGRDVAYHFGAVHRDVYRGLQHSFDNAHRELSLGTLVHAHALARVCAEGVALYDLGQDTPYKVHWSERTYDTSTLVVFRR
jgi:CelD/BcsL family acetyltransferase involved in cellulose biosynthesis